MMYIEKHWETINNLRDISRVIREYYNRELADELDIFIEEQEDKLKEYSEELDWWYENGVVYMDDDGIKS